MSRKHGKRHGANGPGEAMKPDMELTLPARAENIAIVRHALGGLGEAFEIAEEKLSDIRLAVTEACANVVVHAYPQDREPSPRPGWGLMEVCATVQDEELVVTVRDWGGGIRPRSDSPGLGLGLSLIAALAETVQLGHDPQEHTEVRMTFSLWAEPAQTNGAGIEARGVAATAVGSARPDSPQEVGDGRA